MSTKRTYGKDWEDSELFPELAPWIKKGKDNLNFSCRVCAGNQQ